MPKNKITFVFDDEKDAKEVIEALTRRTNITWNYDLKVAMISAFPKTMTALVSKSVFQVPKPIRL